MLIDAHCHLDRYLHKRFGSEIRPILRQIEEHRILTISNSLDLASYKANCRIARKCAYVIPAFGIHPRNAHRYVDRVGLVKKLISKAEVVGEIGLDHYYVKERARYSAQAKIFRLFLSETRDKVVSVHTKGAERAVLDLLRRYENERVIIHWFSGDLEVLDDMIKEGYYFSIVPEVRSSDHMKKIVKRVQLKQILTETDNPGGPVSYMGEKGLPIHIRIVVEEIARVKGVSLKQVEKAVEQNLSRLTGEFAESILPVVA
jgi:TatD DNase family protein